MAQHELTTNATKYGSLSNGEGRVHVEWLIDAAIALSGMPLTWNEEGGASFKGAGATRLRLPLNPA
jgi:two-component sensor histidine kinase